MCEQAGLKLCIWWYQLFEACCSSRLTCRWTFRFFGHQRSVPPLPPFMNSGWRLLSSLCQYVHGYVSQHECSKSLDFDWLELKRLNLREVIRNKNPATSMIAGGLSGLGSIQFATSNITSAATPNPTQVNISSTDVDSNSIPLVRTTSQCPRPWLIFSQHTSGKIEHSVWEHNDIQLLGIPRNYPHH